MNKSEIKTLLAMDTISLREEYNMLMNRMATVHSKHFAYTTMQAVMANKAKHTKAVKALCAKYTTSYHHDASRKTAEAELQQDATSVYHAYRLAYMKALHCDRATDSYTLQRIGLARIYRQISTPTCYMLYTAYGLWAGALALLLTYHPTMWWIGVVMVFAALAGLHALSTVHAGRVEAVEDKRQDQFYIANEARWTNDRKQQGAYGDKISQLRADIQREHFYNPFEEPAE